MAKLVKLVKGKIIGTGDTYLSELVAVDTNAPASYVKKWDIGRTSDDSVTAYLTGSSSDYTLHIYGCGKMQNYSAYNQTPWTSYRVKRFVAHDGITAIGNFTIAGDTNGGRLTSISLSSTVREIGVSAFNANNNSITALSIGNGVRHIKNNAFSELKSLTSVSIPQSVILIDNFAFEGAPWYTSQTSVPVIVGNGVLLKDNMNTAERVIPQGVRFISGLNPYTVNLQSGGNRIITSLTLPDNLYGFGRFSLDYVTSLTSLTVPDTVRWIDTAAFRGFGGVTINIPPKLMRIPSRMLLNCANLEHIFIPGNVKEVWSWEHGNNPAESGPFPNGSPFFNSNANLHIYCEAAEKPQGFDDYWDYTGATQRATVHWGVTKTEYQAVTGGA